MAQGIASSCGESPEMDNASVCELVISFFVSLASGAVGQKPWLKKRIRTSMEWGEE